MRLSKETRSVIEGIVRLNSVVAAEEIDLLIKSRELAPKVDVLIDREIARARNAAVARIRDDRDRRVAFVMPGSAKKGIGSLIVNIERSRDKRAFKTLSDSLRRKAEGIIRSWEKIQTKQDIKSKTKAR